MPGCSAKKFNDLAGLKLHIQFFHVSYPFLCPVYGCEEAAYAPEKLSLQNRKDFKTHMEKTHPAWNIEYALSVFHMSILRHLFGTNWSTGSSAQTKLPCRVEQQSHSACSYENTLESYSDEDTTSETSETIDQFNAIIGVLRAKNSANPHEPVVSLKGDVQPESVLNDFSNGSKPHHNSLFFGSYQLTLGL